MQRSVADVGGGLGLGWDTKLFLILWDLPLHTILELPLQRDRSAWNVPFALHTHKSFQCLFLGLEQFEIREGLFTRRLTKSQILSFSHGSVCHGFKFISHFWAVSKNRLKSYLKLRICVFTH